VVSHPLLTSRPRPHLLLEVAEQRELAHPEGPIGWQTVIVDQVKPQAATHLQGTAQDVTLTMNTIAMTSP
jgi:hypothetical protein